MNKNQARLWAATAPRADMEDMLLTEWGFSPPVTMTDDQMRTALLSRINNARWRWRSTHIPMGWTPPTRTGIANNWPLAVLATAAGLAILLGVAIGAMWLASDPFDDDGTTPAQPTVQPTAAPPTATPTQTQTATAATPTPGNGGGNLNGKAPIYDAAKFRHPNQFVACQKTFDPVKNQVDWLLCEPGVLLTNTATFTRPEVDAVHHSNCPEGGFWYGSMHHGAILLPDSVGGVRLELKDYGEGTNHLIVIRCRLSDGVRDSDLNFTMKIGDFKVGHAIWSPIPPNDPNGSAYTSMEWFGEQIITSHTTGGTNCGSDGCSKIYVNLYDVNSQSWQEFLVTNVNGETSDADGDGIVDYASANWSLVSSNR